MPAPLGSFAWERGGHSLLLALGTELRRFEPDSGRLQTVAELEAGDTGNRLNDGKCDRQGRFWVGTMRDGTSEALGALYRFAGGGEAVRVREGIAIPTSLAFSPDGRTMYFADTVDGRILAFDYDPLSGTPSHERTFAELGSAPGRPGRLDGRCGRLPVERSLRRVLRRALRA